MSGLDPHREVKNTGVFTKAIESPGFKRIVTASDGKRYHLPPAECIYNYAGATLAAVTDTVTRKADSIETSTVLVHQSEDLRGTNLKPAF